MAPLWHCAASVKCVLWYLCERAYGCQCLRRSWWHDVWHLTSLLLQFFVALVAWCRPHKLAYVDFESCLVSAVCASQWNANYSRCSVLFCSYFALQIAIVLSLEFCCRNWFILVTYFLIISRLAVVIGKRFACFIPVINGCTHSIPDVVRVKVRMIWRDATDMLILSNKRTWRCNLWWWWWWWWCDQLTVRCSFVLSLTLLITRHIHVLFCFCLP